MSPSREALSGTRLGGPAAPRHTHQVLWHTGGTGGFRSFLGFVKETETGVVVLSNCARSVDAIGFRILEASGGGFAARR